MFLLKIKSYKLTRFYRIVPGELAMTKFCEPSIFFSLVDNFINRLKTRKKLDQLPGQQSRFSRKTWQAQMV